MMALMIFIDCLMIITVVVELIELHVAFSTISISNIISICSFFNDVF